MGKSKKEKNKPEDESFSADVSQGELKTASYDDKLKHVSIIADPMASKKLAKKLYKLIKKASKQKGYLRNGLKMVQKHVRKGETGLVIFAGDVTPVDIMCHMPAVLEERKIPYAYTPSRQDLGTAMGVKRGSLMVLVRENDEYQELYDDCKNELQLLPLPIYSNTI